MSGFEYTEHPVLAVPTAGQAEVMGADKWIEAMKRREEIIRREKEDPLVYGWEPWIWRVCDALLGFDRIKGFPLDAGWAEEIRGSMGFEHPVSQLLISGGNRGGKSEYAAKRCSMIEQLIRGARVWAFAENNANSIEEMQKRGWVYLPVGLRKKIKTSVAYISYSQKYGFSDNKYVTPNGSEKSYRNYQQDVNTLEGGECDLIWDDELVPPDWVETQALRIATRAGRLILSFTPVRGYSPTVKLFQDGAEAVLENVGYLLPRDEGEPREDLAMRRQESLGDKSEIPEGRKFEMVPRVMRCFDENKAVVFFETCDNPYGNPPEVWKMIRAGSRAYIKERWYGIASKAASARFPKFSVKKHVLADESIPKLGTNYLIGDPAEGRNFFFIWVRRVGKRFYIYREWPSFYEIPVIGVPGAWALPDGKHPDGKRGPAQDPFGYGLESYKREIARLEGWADFGGEDFLQKGAKGAKGMGMGEGEGDSRCSGKEPGELKPVAEWDEWNGARERVEMRYLDSRAASSPRIENDRPVTLQERFLDIGLNFELTPGDDIAEGVTLVNDLLDWDEGGAEDDLNCPHLYVASGCRNVIFALQNWTGKDGRRGACKDPVDVVRYMALLGLEEVDEGSWESAGGGVY